MSVSINNQTYYLIAEACEIAGTNKNTLLRWIRDGRFADAAVAELERGGGIKERAEDAYDTNRENKNALGDE